MSEVQVGERVGAILSAEEGGTIQFLGWGTYDGLQTPPGMEGDIEELMRRFRASDPDLDEAEARLFAELSSRNPRITLESGQVVWGFECWWGPAAKIEMMLSTAKAVVPVDIEVHRARLRQAYNDPDPAEN